MMFYRRLVHSTSNFLQNILWCYVAEHFRYDSELAGILNGKSSYVNDFNEHFRRLYDLCLFSFAHVCCDICFEFSAFGLMMY